MPPETIKPVKNPYKNIPNCDYCKFAAGVYRQILNGKHICIWCLDDFKKNGQEKWVR